MSRAYTSYTTIRCGNRKMAERIGLIFTMETDSPVLDGSPDSQRWGTVLLTYMGKSDLEFSRLESWSQGPFFYKSWSWSWSWTSESWSWNPRVSVSVLGLVTIETQWHVQSAASIARKSLLSACHLCSVERIFSHSGLLMRANRARMGDNVLSQLVYLRCNNKL